MEVVLIPPAADPSAPSAGSLTVRVRAVAAGGAGVADLPDGRVVFIPRTAPGDVVSIRLGRSRRRWATGAVQRIVEASPHRVEPPCPLFGTCGGCQLQHLSYEDQLRWKGRAVADALARIGGVAVEPDTVMPSPRVLGYRNRVSFTLRRLRGGRVTAGFHGAEQPGFIVDVEECLLAEVPIRDMWRKLRKGWGPRARLLPDGGSLRLTLRATASGVTLLVEGGPGGWSAAPLASAVDGFAGVWHRPRGADRPIHVSGDAEVEDRWLDDAFPLAGAAFLQVNRGAAEALHRYVVEAVEGAERVVDGYCGVGVYGRALARMGSRVTGIESDADACRAARHRAPEGFTVVEGAVEERLAGLLPVDAVIVNPPRTGLHPDVARALKASPVRSIVYVSCDPATLARDAGLLAPVYRLRRVRCFDLFPQTSHVESVATFVAGENP